jgi:hypothetical protein
MLARAATLVRPMKTANRLRAAIAAMLVAASLPAIAVNMKFNDIPYTGETAGVGPTYSAKGYTLYYAPAAGESFPTGLFVANPEWPYNGRSPALFANSCTATTRLAADDNNPFTLKSIWLAPLSGEKGGVVVFIAVKADNSQVRAHFALDDRTTWKRYNFPSTFTNLQYAMWVQGDCVVNPTHMFDNVRVSPTSAAGRVENDEDD